MRRRHLRVRRSRGCRRRCERRGRRTRAGAAVVGFRRPRGATCIAVIGGSRRRATGISIRGRGQRKRRPAIFRRAATRRRTGTFVDARRRDHLTRGDERLALCIRERRRGLAMTFDGLPRLAPGFAANVIGVRAVDAMPWLEEQGAVAALGRLPRGAGDRDVVWRRDGRPATRGVARAGMARRAVIVIFEFLGGQPLRRQRQLVRPQVRGRFGLLVAIPHDERPKVQR